MTGAQVVARARALVGTRFRPQGRDPRFGLDCLGLVIAAHGLPPAEGRTDYRLRGNHWAEVRAGMERDFREVGRTETKPGDVLLLQVLGDQLHLAIAAAGSFIHADAAVGRVVECPGQAPWPIVEAFRRRAHRQ